MNRFSTGKFTGQYKATIGADFVSHETVVTDMYGQRHFVTLQIWDTAGQERFQSLGVAFYRGSDGCMLVYDTTDPHSLDHLSHWQSEFLNQVGGGMGGGLGDSNAQFPFVVVGNKCDKVS
jgi:Ras-related protein Rab-7A